MPSGVIRLRASRINHPMPMMADPYSGDISGLRGRKTRDSSTLVHRKRPSMPVQPGTFKKYDDVPMTPNEAVDKPIDSQVKLSKHGKKHGSSKGR